MASVQEREGDQRSTSQQLLPCRVMPPPRCETLHAERERLKAWLDQISSMEAMTALSKLAYYALPSLGFVLDFFETIV